jgi:DNA repair ATPase RecN
MTGAWGVAAGIIGSALAAVALVGAAVFAGRATRAAARLTAEAQRAAAEAAAEPQQRAADLAAFREIREGLDRRIERQERRIDSLTSLVRAYGQYVSDLISVMRQHDIEPPIPPQRIDEYNRTGV